MNKITSLPGGAQRWRASKKVRKMMGGRRKPEMTDKPVFRVCVAFRRGLPGALPKGDKSDPHVSGRKTTNLQSNRTSSQGHILFTFVFRVISTTQVQSCWRPTNLWRLSDLKWLLCNLVKRPKVKAKKIGPFVGAKSCKLRTFSSLAVPMPGLFIAPSWPWQGPFLTVLQSLTTRHTK